MTLTFELDLYSVEMSQHAEDLGYRAFSSKVIFQIHRQTHWHWTNCSVMVTRTTTIMVDANWLVAADP